MSDSTSPRPPESGSPPRQLRGLAKTLAANADMVGRVAVAIAQSLSIIFFAAPKQAIDGFSLDDSWIHQVVGRTFAATGTLGYAQGHHGAAATSYLWAVILSANFAFVHVNPVYYTLAINVACTLAAGQALFILTDGDALFERRDEPATLRAFRSALACGLAASGGNFVWVAFSGMEQMLLVALCLWAIVWSHPSSNRPYRPLYAGLCAGALSVTRPELMLFGPFLLASRIWADRANWMKTKAIPWRPLGLMGAPWLAGVLLYVGSNRIATGTAMPSTLAGRTWLWLGLDVWKTRSQIELTFAHQWVMRLRDYTLGTSSMPALWVTLGIAGFGVWRVMRSSNLGLRVAYAWGAVHTLTYVAMLPSPGQGGRYQIFVMLFYLHALAIGSIAILADALRAWRGAPPAISWVLAPASIAAWIGLVVVGVRDWSHDHAKAVSHVRATELGLGPLIDALPTDAKVASFDIGGSGYAAHRPIVDIGGLVDPKSAQAMMAGNTWEYLRDNHVSYVILSQSYDETFPEPVNVGYRLRMMFNPAIKLTKLRDLSSPPDVWLPSVKSTWNTAARQDLYRIEYTGNPGPRPLPVPASAKEVEGDLLTSEDRARTNYGIALLAAEGVKVSLRAERNDSHTPTSGDDYAISFGPWGIRIEPTAIGSSAQSMIFERMVPYMKLHDYGGAAIASLHAILRVTQVEKDPTVYPLLPPQLPPLPNGGLDDLDTSRNWGLMVMGLFVALGIVLERFAWRRASVSSYGQTSDTQEGTPGDALSGQTTGA